MATLPVLTVLLFLTKLATVSGEFNLGFHFIFKTLISNCLFYFLRSNGDNACYEVGGLGEPILDLLTYLCSSHIISQY
jgi:hypothetical protein